MPKFPEPPPVATLRALGAEVRVLPPGTMLWRVYFAGGPHPTGWSTLRHFGPTDARFDHHQPPPHVQARGILYAAAQWTTCVAEVFQATRVIDTALGAPRLAAFALARQVRLLDLASPWLTRAGASTALHSGARARARRWSAAVYDAYPALGGLAYGASMHAGAPAFALYERAAHALPASPRFDRALDDSALRPWLDAVGMTLGYALV